MKLKGTVMNGAVAVDLPDGTPVTMTVDDPAPCPGVKIQFDDKGELIVTPELEEALAQSDAELARGERIPWREAIARLRNRQ